MYYNKVTLSLGFLSKAVDVKASFWVSFHVYMCTSVCGYVLTVCRYGSKVDVDSEYL